MHAMTSKVLPLEAVIVLAGSRYEYFPSDCGPPKFSHHQFPGHHPLVDRPLSYGG